MRGPTAVEAEVVWRLHKADAEVIMPQPIDDHPGEQRIVLVRDPIGQLLPSMSPGYGFAAIIVAFVGRLHPLGVALASLLMSLLYLGGESAQVNLALPSAVTGLFQGTLLFLLLAADVLVDYRVRVVQRAAAA